MGVSCNFGNIKILSCVILDAWQENEGCARRVPVDHIQYLLRCQYSLRDIIGFDQDHGFIGIQVMVADLGLRGKLEDNAN